MMQNIYNTNKGNTPNPWLSILDHWQTYCFQYLWPSIYKKINWNKPIEKLESSSFVEHCKEPQLLDNVDLLYKVCSSEEENCLIWIHLDNREAVKSEKLGEELFNIYQQFYAKYQQTILPLVILVNAKTESVISPYEMSVLNHKVHCFEFQTILLHQWVGQEESLLNANNFFEKVISIYLISQKMPQDEQEYYQKRLELHHHLINQFIDKEDFLRLYNFLDSMIPLPEDLKEQYYEEVYALERDHQINYLTKNEYYGIEQWKQKGFQEGVDYAINRVLHNMVEDGRIDREIMKKVLEREDRDLNALLIASYHPDHQKSPATVTDAIDQEVAMS